MVEALGKHRFKLSLKLHRSSAAIGTGEGGGKCCISSSGGATAQHIPRCGGSALVRLKSVDISLHPLDNPIQGSVELIHCSLLPSKIVAVHVAAEFFGLRYDVVGRLRPPLRGHGLPFLGHLRIPLGDLVQRRVHLRFCGLGGLVGGDAALDDRKQKRRGKVRGDLLFAGLLLCEQVSRANVRPRTHKAAGALADELHKRSHHSVLQQHVGHSAAHKSAGQSSGQALHPRYPRAFQIVCWLHIPDGQCSGISNRISSQERERTVHYALHCRSHLKRQGSFDSPKKRICPPQQGQIPPHVSHSGSYRVLSCALLSSRRKVAIHIVRFHHTILVSSQRGQALAYGGFKDGSRVGYTAPLQECHSRRVHGVVLLFRDEIHISVGFLWPFGGIDVIEQPYLIWCDILIWHISGVPEQLFRVNVAVDGVIADIVKPRFVVCFFRPVIYRGQPVGCSLVDTFFLKIRSLHKREITGVQLFYLPFPL